MKPEKLTWDIWKKNYCEMSENSCSKNEKCINEENNFRKKYQKRSFVQFLSKILIKKKM